MNPELNPERYKVMAETKLGRFLLGDESVFMTHTEAIHFKRAHTEYPWRRLFLVEAHR